MKLILKWKKKCNRTSSCHNPDNLTQEMKYCDNQNILYIIRVVNNVIK